MNSVDVYRILKNVNGQSQTIPAYEPVPRDVDYSSGFLYRYFVRKRSDDNGIITEINKQTFDGFVNNAYYIPLRIRWKIVGTQYDVEEANRKSIQLGQETISNLDTYTKNLTKFWRG